MNYTNLPLFTAMKAKLSYTSERQGVLAQNIANVDTPGYRARDVVPPDFKDVLSRAPGSRLAMTMTSGQHLASGAGSASGHRIVTRASTYEQSPVGNNVSIEEEMMRVSQNQSEYQRTINLYRKTIALFKTALGSGGGQ